MSLFWIRKKKFEKEFLVVFCYVMVQCLCSESETDKGTLFSHIFTLHEFHISYFV
jgi:hypothetical protein